MYFSQNKKPSERRANDEYRRRMAGVRPPVEESLPTLAPTQNDAPPAVETCTGCSDNADKIFAPSLAMVYAKKQTFQNLYEPEEALARGTLFADLDLPFEGRSVTRK